MKNNDLVVSNFPDPVVVPERIETETGKFQAQNRLQRPRPTKAVMHIKNVVRAADCDDTVSPRGYVSVDDLSTACRASDVVVTLEFNVNRPSTSSKIATQARNATVDDVLSILNSPYRATGASDLLTQVSVLVEKLRVV